MRFRVGPYTYTLRIPAEPVKDQEGMPAMGLASWEGREILIDTRVLPHQRLEVLLHELGHCWEYHVPRARDEEERASFTAMVAEAAYQDLDRYGGPEALERLEPEAWGREVAPIAAEVEAAVDVDGLRYEPVDCVSRAESPHDAHGARAQCGRCCSLVAGGAVVNSPARWSDVAAGRVMTRTLFCSHCGHLQQWVEGATPAGQPNGAVVSGPEYVDGPAVGDFLRQHPEAIGVMVE